MNEDYYSSAGITDVEPLERIWDALLERLSVCGKLNHDSYDMLGNVVKHGVPQIEYVQYMGDRILDAAERFIDPAYDYSLTNGLDAPHNLTKAYIQKSDHPISLLPGKGCTFDEDSLSAYGTYLANCAYWLDKMRYTHEPDLVYTSGMLSWKWEWVDSTINGEHRDRLGWDVDDSYPQGYNGREYVPPSACPESWQGMAAMCSAQENATYYGRLDGGNYFDFHYMAHTERDGVMCYDRSTVDRKGFFGKAEMYDISNSVRWVPMKLQVTNPYGYDADVFVALRPGDKPNVRIGDLIPTAVEDDGPYTFRDTQYWTRTPTYGTVYGDEYYYFGEMKPRTIRHQLVEEVETTYVVSSYEYNASGTECLSSTAEYTSWAGWIGWEEYDRAIQYVVPSVSKFRSVSDLFNGSGTIPTGSRFVGASAHTEDFYESGIDRPIVEENWMASATEILDKTHTWEPNGLNDIGLSISNYCTVQSVKCKPLVIYGWHWNTEL